MTTSVVPEAVHRGHDELPWVDLGDGVLLQLLHVKVDEGLWVVRNRFPAGARVVRHRHTGPVYAFTHAGRWKYAEYPEVNVAGSYLYEPAGSEHTLVVPDDNDEETVATFVIHGANINLGDDDEVVSVYDAGSVLRFYRKECARLGFERPHVVGADA